MSRANWWDGNKEIYNLTPLLFRPELGNKFVSWTSPHGNFPHTDTPSYGERPHAYKQGRTGPACQGTRKSRLPWPWDDGIGIGSWKVGARQKAGSQPGLCSSCRYISSKRKTRCIHKKCTPTPAWASVPDTKEVEKAKILDVSFTSVLTGKAYLHEPYGQRKFKQNELTQVCETWYGAPTSAEGAGPYLCEVSLDYLRKTVANKWGDSWGLQGSKWWYYLQEGQEGVEKLQASEIHLSLREVTSLPGKQTEQTALKTISKYLNGKKMTGSRQPLFFSHGTF